MSDEVLAEQIAYYRARAPEYDAEIVRMGGYSAGAPQGELSDREVERNTQFTAMKALLRSLGPVERALELACGSGNWTAELAHLARDMVAVDASPEMLAYNNLRVAAPNVAYQEADLFAWQPAGDFELVLFAFWLTHVPSDRFERFWELAAACLAPGGAVFFVDNLTDDSASPEQPVGEGIVRRRLNDGRDYRIVKVYYTAAELAARLRALGWSADVRTFGTNYLCGVCRRWPS